jgi:magnesium chelatase accessory protein
MRSPDHSDGTLDWATESRHWPHAQASRFIRVGPIHWHVQHFGPPPDRAPVVLLLHGTGASTHSWRDLAPLLAERHHVVVPDLPGHGFSRRPPNLALSLPVMGRLLDDLLVELGLQPQIIVGHSAGAVIGAWLALHGHARGPLPTRALHLVGLNGAWQPFGGNAAHWISPATQLLASSGWAAHGLARLAASDRVLERLLRGTGSRIDAAGRRGYATLVASPAHVSAALSMMAHWDLRLLQDQWPRLGQVPCALSLVVGDADPMVPPAQSLALQRRVPGARLHSLPGLGHLAHEEAPEAVARILLADALR